jgi:hypothetical protein
MRRLVTFACIALLVAGCAGSKRESWELWAQPPRSGREAASRALEPPKHYSWSSLPLGILTTGYSSLRYLMGLDPHGESQLHRLRAQLSDGTLVGGLLYPYAGDDDEPVPLLMASFGFLQDRWGTEAAKFHEHYVDDPLHRLRAHVLLLDHPSSGTFLALNGNLSVGSYDDARMWIELAQILRSHMKLSSIHLFGVSMSGQTVVHALIEDARLGLGLFDSGVAVSIAPDFREAPGRQLARVEPPEGTENPWRRGLDLREQKSADDRIQTRAVKLLIGRQFVSGYRRIRPDGDPPRVDGPDLPLFLWSAFEARIRALRRRPGESWNRDFSLGDLRTFMATTRIADVIDRVRTPLVLLSAEDDPAVDRASFEEVVTAAGDDPWIAWYESKRGGHFGFDVAYGRGYLRDIVELMLDPRALAGWNGMEE